MSTRFKFALLVLGSGGVAFGAGGCLAQFLGDVVGDQFWLRFLG